MNFRYVLVMALFSSAAVFGQRAQVEGHHKLGFGEKPAVQPHSSMVQSMAKAAGDTLFHEDFANGLAGNTALGAWTTGGADGALWLPDTDGPNGDFSNAATEKITSPTAANGFMIFDSNLFNDGCVASASCATLNGTLETPVMDLSGTPNVHLSFATTLRWCCAGDRAHFVDISTDGGASWPTRVVVSENIAVNEEIYTNENPGTFTRSINLSAAIAANPSTVKIRFNHDGNSNGNMSHYFWQIDDVMVVESEENDLRMYTAHHDDYDNTPGVSHLPYSVYPYGQLRELQMFSRYRNEGSNDASNAVVTADVSGPGGFTWSGSDTRAVVVAGSADSAVVTGLTPPATSGDYVVDFTLSSDSADTHAGDNAGQVTFGVDEFWYAQDEGAMDDEDDNAGDAFILGNLFYIENDQMLYAIDVCITGSNNSIGSVVDGQLLDGNLDLLALTAEYEIVSQSVFTSMGGADWLSLVFDQPVQLLAGEEYVVAVEDFGGSDIAISTSGRSIPQVSFIYNPTAAGGADWFYVTTTPMVRMNFDATIGIEEGDVVDGVGLGQSFPNPSEGAVSIPYNLEKAARVSFEIRDISGKLIRTISEGQRAAGTYRLELDLGELSEGTYFYTMTANGVQLTKRLAVTK